MKRCQQRHNVDVRGGFLITIMIKEQDQVQVHDYGLTPMYSIKLLSSRTESIYHAHFRPAELFHKRRSCRDHDIWTTHAPRHKIIDQELAIQVSKAAIIRAIIEFTRLAGRNLQRLLPHCHS